jgi:hypothetical protein
MLTLYCSFHYKYRYGPYGVCLAKSWETLADEVALLWGIEYYNTELLNADEDQLGSVTTEMLLNKDADSFTLRNGWAFPRRIYFNGENCEMALPDTFPMLPNGSSSLRSTYCQILLVFLAFITLLLLGFDQ